MADAGIELSKQLKSDPMPEPPKAPPFSKPWTYGAGKSAATTAHDASFGDSDCDKACIEAQLDSFYGSDDSRPLKPPKKQRREE